MWFERAEKVMKHLKHFSLLLDSFKYMGEMANKLNSETTPNLKKSFKEEKSEKIKSKKYELIQEIKKFLELYQTYSLMKEYDYWDHKNSPMYSLYFEKFEKQ